MNQLPTAVFLDRDGTIIEDAHYLSRPEQVKLIDNAAEAIARINALLIPVIVATNQSGIARGIFTVEDYERVRKHLNDLLTERGAHIDASYYCPHAPEEGCECRKPGTLMFRMAKKDNPDIDLARSLYIGDRFRDIEPALTLGGQGVLVPSPETPRYEIEAATTRARVAPSLAVALDWFLCSNYGLLQSDPIAKIAHDGARRCACLGQRNQSSGFDRSFCSAWQKFLRADCSRCL